MEANTNETKQDLLNLTSHLSNFLEKTKSN